MKHEVGSGSVSRSIATLFVLSKSSVPVGVLIVTVFNKSPNFAPETAAVTV